MLSILDSYYNMYYVIILLKKKLTDQMMYHTNGIPLEKKGLY